ncbi:uncharacterized protein LOC115884922 isoform X2 [Sitophilus oryzae]|uniref:Uncharacterized protein LOC115884922 isoform X2 n=1 Tax=Sitophilus oryzae TaxID=7048 RepID=A0A6J2Y7B8_SITOR|nr:uncharacterized protein LOC115884922 isoform X2 [Sitophilus oryzae]
MNTSKDKTLYKFIKKTDSLEVQTSSNEATTPKICTCYMKKGKFFEFQNSTQKSLKEISNDHDLELFKKPLDPNKNKEDLNSFEQFEVCESPYFTEISKNAAVVQINHHDKTSNSKQTLSHSTVYDEFQPKFNSTQFSTGVVYSSADNIASKSNSAFFRDNNNNNDDIVAESMLNARPNMHFTVKDSCLKPNCCCSNFLPSKQEILDTIAQNIEAVNKNIKNNLLGINKQQIIEESLSLNDNFSSQTVHTLQNNIIAEESNRKSKEQDPEADEFKFQFSNDLFTEVSSFKSSPNVSIHPNNENIFKNINNQSQTVKNSGEIKNLQNKPSTFKFQFSNEVLSRNFPTRNDPPKKSDDFSVLDEAIAPTKSFFDDTCLVITLPETNEKKKMFEDLLNEVRREQNQSTCNSGEYPEFESGKVVMDSQNMWIKCYNDAGGKYYTNKRTGMVSKTTPKLMEMNFSFGSRLGFVPKGLSPVLKGHLPVNKVMSQKSKNKLQEFILESYENELLVVKWQNYISDDPVEFFKEIYQEKAKTIENGIMTLQNSAFKKWKNEINFKQEMLSDLEILGQADKKFIVAVHKTDKLLVLFDQHAVHERIRLESILKEYKGKKSKCKENLTFFLPRNDLSLLKKHTSYLSSLGLDVRFFTDGLSLLNIPLCIQEKYCSSDCKEDLNKILLTLINDILEFLKQARCSTPKLPKIIQNLLNLKACRGNFRRYKVW